MIDGAPAGVKFNPIEQEGGKLACPSNIGDANWQIEKFNDDEDIVKIGHFLIHIKDISMEDMLKMRQLLPRLQYQYMKNRKGSRITRQRRKKAQSEASQSLEEMRAENTKLAKIAHKMQKKLMKVLAYLGEDDSLAASSFTKSDPLEISNSDYGSSAHEVQS